MRKMMFLLVIMFSSTSFAVKKLPYKTIDSVFKDYWHFLMHEYPEWSTMVGVGKYDHLWTNLSLESHGRRLVQLKYFLNAANGFTRKKLGVIDSLNLKIFIRELKGNIKAYDFDGHLMPVNQLGGVHQEAARTLTTMPSKTVKDFENIIGRLRRLPKQIDQTTELMSLGLKKGVTPPRITLREVGNQIRAQIVKDPSKSPLLVKFLTRPNKVSQKDFDRLKALAESLYEVSIKPSLQRFHGFFVNSYYPKTRTSIALREMPKGESWYQYRVKHYTTTDRSPKEVHNVGLMEVARIRREMEKVIKGSGFKGNFKAFTEFLRTDKRFYFTDSVALIGEYQRISKKAEAGLAKMFSELPSLGFEVKAVPKYAEKSQTTAYYMPGALKTNRLGVFYANTYNLNSRPKWEMEALTLHEAVPGHHLQIALAEQMGTLPEFRRFGGFTAFIEGWGLYSESLGTEMGFYQDPYSKFGQLSYEMWRAIRLVVDTGMHYFGWSRNKAIQYFAKNTGKPVHDITVEVDRYIVWPGQALAYKTGELKIKELRAYAQTKLGDRFDIREFHDRILSYGALPLDILEDQVKGWVAGMK